MTAIESLEDLLSASLEQYRPAFHQSGFDHLDHLLTMEEDEWQHMLVAVSEEFARMNQDIPMKAGHKLMIISRLKQEKVRRQNLARERNERLAAEDAARHMGADAAAAAGALGHTGTMTGTGNMGSPRRTRTGAEGQLSDNTGGDESRPPSTKTVVVMQGFKCLGSHWMCCFGISMMSLIVSLFLYLLYSHLTVSHCSCFVRCVLLGAHPPACLCFTCHPAQKSYSGRPDDSWEFVRVIFICGFTISCVTFCICLMSWLTNPEQRTCEMPEVRALLLLLGPELLPHAALLSAGLLRPAGVPELSLVR